MRHARSAVFTTSRLAIEPLAVAHADELHAALDHPDVHRYLPNPEVTTVAALRTRLEQLAVIGVKHMDEVLRHALAHPQPDEFLREPSMVVDWRIVETMPPSDPRDAH